MVARVMSAHSSGRHSWTPNVRIPLQFRAVKERASERPAVFNYCSPWLHVIVTVPIELYGFALCARLGVSMDGHCFTGHSAIRVTQFH